jgi:hypothetical protein
MLPPAFFTLLRFGIPPSVDVSTVMNDFMQNAHERFLQILPSILRDSLIAALLSFEQNGHNMLSQPYFFKTYTQAKGHFSPLLVAFLVSVFAAFWRWLSHVRFIAEFVHRLAESSHRVSVPATDVNDIAPF